MNNFIKQVIEEKFASKKQQRFFYAKAADKSTPKKERKKWSKWAKEYSDKTNFKKLPDEVKEKEVEEVVDNQGNYIKGKKDGNLASKGVTANKTTDEFVQMSGGQMGLDTNHGASTTIRYWAESDMSKSLGYDDTLGKDEDYDDAKDHFEDELGLEEPEAEDRLSQMGYDKNLPKDKVRLVENPKKFIEEYIDSILSKKSKQDDLVKKNSEDEEVNPIIIKQLKALKNTLDSNNISLDTILKHLKNDE